MPEPAGVAVEPEVGEGAERPGAASAVVEEEAAEVGEPEAVAEVEAAGPDYNHSLRG